MVAVGVEAGQGLDHLVGVAGPVNSDQQVPVIRGGEWDRVRLLEPKRPVDPGQVCPAAAESLGRCPPKRTTRANTRPTTIGRPTMPDWQDLFKELQNYLPAQIVGVLLFISLMLALAKQLQVVQGAQYLWKLIKTVRTARPEEDYRARALFCGALMRRIERINEDERWQDGNYSDLEAEVESEASTGRVRSTLRLLFLDDFRRRERSLSRAILESQDAMVFLRGDPGSGKSVALRHAASILAKRACGRRSKSPIPVYVTLRELQREHICSHESFKKFLVDSMQSLVDIRQLDFFATHYDDLVRRGRLVFLLDGFDEIVEILSATEAGPLVRRYQDFLEGYVSSVAPCRAIIASRDYRGPLRKELPQFTIVPLDAKHRSSIMKMRKLDQLSRNRLIEGLAKAPPDMHALASNSMFMGLLCEYVQFNDHFPSITDQVFKAYVNDRLRIVENYLGINKDVTILTAQQLAFAMLSNSRLGLTASIEQLKAALREMRVATEPVDDTVRALQQARLARSESVAATASGPTLTFSHRRFQEFFATGYLLGHPQVVTDRDLLLKGEWRESAVTILQHHDNHRVSSLIGEAADILSQLGITRPGAPITDRAIGAAASRFRRFDWPPNSLHLLELLDAGLPLRESTETYKVRIRLTRMIFRAFAYGGTSDMKWALDGSSKVVPGCLAILFRRAFESGSQLLRNAAFQQIGRLYPVPNDIVSHIVRGLLTLSASGDLPSQGATLKAQVSRLEDQRGLANAMSMLRVLPGADLLANLLLMTVLISPLILDASGVTMVAICALTSAASFPVLRMSTAICWPFSDSESSLRRVAQSAALQIAAFSVWLLSRATLIAVTYFSLPLWLCILCAYVLSWAPSVVVSLRLDSLKPVPVLWIVPQGVAVATVARRIFASLNVREIAGMILTVAIAAVILGALHWGATHPDSPVSKAMFLAAGGIGLLIFVLCLLTVLVFGTRFAIRLGRDLARLHSLMSKPPKRLSPEDFLALVGSLNTGLAMSKLMIVLRKSNLFKDSPDSTADLLRELAHLNRWMLPLVVEVKNDNLTRKQANARRLSRLREFDAEVGEFGAWVRADPERAAGLLSRANQRFWDQCVLASMALRAGERV